jgi:hypothetical protein
VTDGEAREQVGSAGEVPGSSLTVERHDGVHLPGQYKAWCARCADDAESRGTR